MTVLPRTGQNCSRMPNYGAWTGSCNWGVAGNSEDNPMSPVANSLLDSTRAGQSSDSVQPSTPGFSDGLGDRSITFDEATGTSLENLRFKPEFGDAASFEGALRERV